MSKDVLDILFSKKALNLWSFFFFVTPFALLYQGVIKNPLASIITTVVLLVIALMLYFRQHSTVPFFASTVVTLTYLALYFEEHFGLVESQSGLLQPTLFAVLGFGMLMMFDIKLDFSMKNYKRVLAVVGLSAIFGGVFLLLNEPFPSFIKKDVVLLIIYTFFVSLGEELVFRGASFSLARKTFHDKLSIHVQAAIFTLVHLFSIVALFSFYTQYNSLLLSSPLINVILYAAALYGFSYVAAKFAMNKKETSIVYPILFHWLVNFLNLLILIL